MNFGDCVLNFIFFMCSLVVTMEIQYIEFVVEHLIICGLHGPYYEYVWSLWVVVKFSG